MNTDDAPLFPDEAVPRRGRRLVIMAVAVVVSVLAGVVGTSIASGSDSAELRSGAAGTHDVAAELHGVATMEPVVQAAVSFPTDGTVASVDVAVGDAVSVGQQLASLDLEDLTDDLHTAEASRAEAELTLQKALDGESDDSQVASGAATAAPVSSTGDSSPQVVWASLTQEANGNEQLAALQQAVLDAQQAVDRALAGSEAALTAADEVCSASGESEAPEDAATATTATTIEGGSELDACRTALGKVLVAQQETADAQQQLAVASAALDEYLLSQEASGSGATTGNTAGGSSSAPSDGSSSPVPTESPSTSTSPSNSPTTAASPSSAELIALQQQVDAAALGVTVARQAIAQATIVSPIVGTVVAVGFETGDDVAAASATQTVTIEGEDGMEAVTTVTLDDVASVAVGQPAGVVPDGSDTVIDGEVVAVAAVPEDDATTTSYRVTVGFTDGSDELGNGTTGSITIVTDDVRSALAVPTSAVTWQDGRAAVHLITDGVPTATTVEVGIIGAEWTEVLTGVDDGDEVLLADLSEALPGSATETTSSSSDDVGGVMPGGDFPPGGSGGPPRN